MPRRTWNCGHTDDPTHSTGYVATFNKPTKVMICSPCIVRINETPEDPWGAGRSKSKASEVACEKVDNKTKAERINGQDRES